MTKKEIQEHRESQDQKLVKAMCSKEFREFLNNFENIYNSMEKLGCFKNLKRRKE